MGGLIDMERKGYELIGCWTHYIGSLVQERRSSSVLAMELRLFALTHRYDFDPSLTWTLDFQGQN